MWTANEPKSFSKTCTCLCVNPKCRGDWFRKTRVQCELALKFLSCIRKWAKNTKGNEDDANSAPVIIKIRLNAVFDHKDHIFMDLFLLWMTAFKLKMECCLSRVSEFRVSSTKYIFYLVFTRSIRNFKRSIFYWRKIELGSEMTRLRALTISTCPLSPKEKRKGRSS